MRLELTHYAKLFHSCHMAVYVILIMRPRDHELKWHLSDAKQYVQTPTDSHCGGISSCPGVAIDIECTV